MTMKLHAQQQIPYNQITEINKILSTTAYFSAKADSLKTNENLDKLENYCKTLAKDYPLYVGYLKVCQSFHSLNPEQRKLFRNNAISILKNSKSVFVDSFVYTLNDLMMSFYNAGRMLEWYPIDSVFRESVAQSNSPEGYRYSLLNYSNKCLNLKQYNFVKCLSSYDYYCLMSRNSTNPLDKISLMFDDWLIFKCDLDQWMNLSYRQKYPNEYHAHGQQMIEFIGSHEKENNDNIRKLNYYSTFKTLISRINELNNEFIIENNYEKKEYSLDLRKFYYSIYTSIIKGFCSWAIRDQKEGLAILSLKEYLYQNVIKYELESAKKANAKPVLSLNEIVDLFTSLADLYDGIGNGLEELNTVKDGLNTIEKYGKFSKEEIFVGSINLLNKRYCANRLLNNYKDVNRDIKFLKKYTPPPTGRYDNNKVLWERYISIRLQEIYVLLDQNNTKVAKDSLGLILDYIGEKGDSTDNSIYESNFWPELTYLVTTFRALEGTWLTDFILECITDMDKDKTYLPIFYKAQALYLKAIWHNEKKIDDVMLSNLLFYTSRQLKNTFPMLTADDRMQLFEQRLGEYFDIYHELLFSDALNDYPEIKEKIIAQSLSLKNALSDGNLISNETLLKNQSNYSIKRIEEIRQIRQESNEILQQHKLYNYNTTKARVLQDNAQSLWLKMLESAGLDSLTKFTNWKSISSQLKKDEIYTETIRYNRWLSDSTAHYGAFVITPGGKLDLVYLFEENKLKQILNDPSSSPQSAELLTQVSRNAIVSSKQAKKLNNFKTDSVDKLAELILKPLTPFYKDKKTWYLVQDGLLNRISFAALVINSDYLFQKVQLNTLSSSSSLTQKTMKLPQKANVLLSGGLDYGYTTKANENALFKKEFVWNYLPGTVNELSNLGTLFEQAKLSTTVLKGLDFPDTMISNLQNYNLIHLATHGFYLDDSGANDAYNTNFNRSTLYHDPLFRCGIAVSSANNPNQEENKESNGILLGSELANIDLRKCYLISLSACETGLGDIRNNLGVDGLSRALKIAGAQNLLISLWKVPDEPTAVFMKHFYEKLLSGKTPVESLTETQALMSFNYKVSDWAAFVLVN